MKRLTLLLFTLGILFGVILSGCSNTSSNNLTSDNTAQPITRESFVGWWFPLTNDSKLYWVCSTEKKSYLNDRHENVYIGSKDWSEYVYLQNISIKSDGTFSADADNKNPREVGRDYLSAHIVGTWTLVENQITLKPEIFKKNSYNGDDKEVKFTSDEYYKKNNSLPPPKLTATLNSDAHLYFSFSNSKSSSIDANSNSKSNSIDANGQPAKVSGQKPAEFVKQSPQNN